MPVTGIQSVHISVYTCRCLFISIITHENLFLNFYIINLPTIIVIQFIDGVGENANGWKFLTRKATSFDIIDRLWEGRFIIEI